MLGQTPVVVPAWHQDHVISQIFSLYLGLLQTDYVGFEDLEHSLESPFIAPWLVTERVSNAVDIPSGDSDAHLGC